MKNLKKIEQRIEDLREQLSRIGNMRPGTLSTQYRKPAEQKQPFHQISYTRKGKSRSEYVRAENLNAVKKEISAYKRFRDINERLIDLSIEASRIRCRAKTLLKDPSNRPHP